MMDSVYVIGESLVDVAMGSDGVVRRMPGGSPMNVAYGLARMGIATTLMSAFGDDEDGRKISEHLQSAGVRIAPGSITPGATTSTALARLGEDGSASYEFDLRWDIPSNGTIPSDARVVHTGSTASVLEPGAVKALALFERVNAGVLRSFDPNIRPAIMSDRKTVLTWVERFARLSHVVKISEEDAAWLLPGATAQDVVDWGLGLGVRVLALTRGAEGCMIVTAENEIEQSGIPARVVDTIGAGDAFMAAFLAGVIRWGLVDSVVSGSLSRGEMDALASVSQRAAAATVSRAGAQPPDWEEISVADPAHPAAGSFGRDSKANTSLV